MKTFTAENKNKRHNVMYKKTLQSASRRTALV